MNKAKISFGSVWVSSKMIIILLQLMQEVAFVIEWVNDFCLKFINKIVINKKRVVYCKIGFLILAISIFFLM